MSGKGNKPASTIIISVYKDDVALRLILDSLHQQSTDNFEIIVSEDCQSDEIQHCLREYQDSSFHIQHLTQVDDGFRKNIALNRAILASNTEHMIFIDGDCVPHKNFIAAHQRYNDIGIAATGRRLELGENISTRLRHGKIKLSYLNNRLAFFIHSPALLNDKAKNIESGIYSPLLHHLTRERDIRLLGCNFSCNKQDLLKINGFNQDYLSPGIGEDSDIDWRLSRAGVKIKNVKFSAIQYHLYHPRTYTVTDTNMDILRRTKEADQYVCANGIDKTKIPSPQRR